MKKKTIYISGKIGSYEISQEVREKFERAEEYLMREGWDVINPVNIHYQIELKEHLVKIRKARYDVYTEMLIFDLKRIKKCTAIYMLPEWLDSPGARAEHYFAQAIGKEIIYG